MSTITKIGDIRRKLDACISGRNATDSAVRVYEDSKILVEEAIRLMESTEQVLEDAIDAAEAATDAKIAAVIFLQEGVNGLLDTIQNAKSIKRDNALDTCLAIRETVNDTAQTVDRMKQKVDELTELESIAQAAVQTAEDAWLERQRVYNDAIANAEAARNAVIEASKILGL